LNFLWEQKRLQNETIRAKGGFGLEVEPYLQEKPTNARLQMYVCQELPS
jgi:hypothetical protein